MPADMILHNAKIAINRVLSFVKAVAIAGDTILAAGDVEIAVVRGMLLAHDTDKRLQKESLVKGYSLHEWIAEAGPMDFDETITGAQKAIDQANGEIKFRGSAPLLRKE